MGFNSGFKGLSHVCRWCGGHRNIATECVCYLVHLILGNVNRRNEYLHIKMSIALIQTSVLIAVLGHLYKMFPAGLRYLQLRPENCNR